MATSHMVLLEVGGGNIGEADFSVLPRTEEFINFKPEGEERLIFKVVAVVHEMIDPDQPCGDLYLQRVGSTAALQALLRRVKK
jgi:hypothetical protein